MREAANFYGKLLVEMRRWLLNFTGLDCCQNTHPKEVGGPDHLMSILLDVVLGILEGLLYFHIENNRNLIRHLDQYIGSLQIKTPSISIYNYPAKLI